jgi:osmotically inducible lipoprotein OsmB
MIKARATGRKWGMTMFRSSVLKASVAVLPLALAACGTTTEDRALSGAGIGAAGGAIIGAFTGIGPAAGAVIGGAVGAGTGALTDPSQVDLGKPVWRGSPGGGPPQSSAPPPDQVGSAASYPGAGTGAPASYDTVTVRDIQLGLQRLGYYQGPTDGNYGSQTDAAIRHYQQDNHLPVDGQPSAPLLSQIRSRTG